jgi:hypothetical protein
MRLQVGGQTVILVDLRSAREQAVLVFGACQRIGLQHFIATPTRIPLTDSLTRHHQCRGLPQLARRSCEARRQVSDVSPAACHAPGLRRLPSPVTPAFL